MSKKALKVAAAGIIGFFVPAVGFKIILLLLGAEEIGRIDLVAISAFSAIFGLLFAFVAMAVTYDAVKEDAE